jgi:hypothetical protein
MKSAATSPHGDKFADASGQVATAADDGVVLEEAPRGYGVERRDAWRPCAMTRVEAPLSTRSC